MGNNDSKVNFLSKAEAVISGCVCVFLSVGQQQRAYSSADTAVCELQFAQ